MLTTTGVTRLINRSQTFTGCSSSSSSRILLEPKTNPFIPRVANHSTTVSQPYRSTPAPTVHWTVGMSCCCFATCSVVYECKQRVEHRLPSHQKVVVRLRNGSGSAISVSTDGHLLGVHLWCPLTLQLIPSKSVPSFSATCSARPGGGNCVPFVPLCSPLATNIHPLNPFRRPLHFLSKPWYVSSIPSAFFKPSVIGNILENKALCVPFFSNRNFLMNDPSATRFLLYS